MSAPPQPDYVSVPRDLFDWWPFIFTAFPRRVTGPRTWTDSDRHTTTVTVGYHPALGALSQRDGDVFITLCKLWPAHDFAPFTLTELVDLIRSEWRAFPHLYRRPRRDIQLSLIRLATVPITWHNALTHPTTKRPIPYLTTTILAADLAAVRDPETTVH